MARLTIHKGLSSLTISDHFKTWGEIKWQCDLNSETEFCNNTGGDGCLLLL